MNRRELFAMGWLACCVFAAIGCEMTGKMPEGVPANAKFVGQGKGFVYVIPADGRMYRVFRGKVDGIRTAMRKGDTYRAIGPVEGDDPAKNFDEYRYYFEADALAPAGPGK